MMITCAKCGSLFTSVIITPEEAWKEVYTRLGKHYEARHKDVLNLHAVSVAKISAMVIGYLTVSELASVPEDETWVNSHLESMQDIIMEAMGFDIEEEVNDNLEVIPDDAEKGEIESAPVEHTVL